LEVQSRDLRYSVNNCNVDNFSLCAHISTFLMLAYAKYLTAESASTGDKNPVTSTKLKEIDRNEKKCRKCME